jgi:16S rRNA (guanine527-N7)-methyltransferase
VFAELLTAELKGLVDLSGAQIDLLENHLILLQRWNEKLNLTSLKNPTEMIERHYAESLFLGVQIPNGKFSIVDIGSGARFTGIPVAILRPDCAVTLVESHQRKSVFLREAARDLSNIAICTDRIEAVELKFDWAISRAVKFEDIQNAALRMCKRVALLAGAVSPGSNCFTWNEPIRLPWGRERFLWIGTSVPRETIVLA